MWGHGGYGELGQNNTTNRSSPIQVGSGTDWDVVAQAGNETWASGAIKTDGTLWMWGRNSAPAPGPSGGQAGYLGQNNQTQYSSPVQIPGTNWVITGNSEYSFVAFKS